MRRHLPAMDSPLLSRIELEPKYEEQGRAFALALDYVWRRSGPMPRYGGWTWYADEEWYLEELGLKPWIERLATQGRSKGITCVFGMQRPARVSRFVRSEPTHVLTFQISGKDAKSLAEDTIDELEDVARALGPHEFAWYHRPSNRIWTGRLDLDTGELIPTPTAQAAGVA